MIHPLRSLACAMIGMTLLAPGSHAEIDFHVATTGQDINAGTDAAPFATLQRVRDAVREKTAAGLTDNVVVTIHGGTYPQMEMVTFGPEDSGTKDHSVTYTAAPGEQVIFDGGRSISNWQKGPGEIWTTEIPEAKDGKWYFRQLFVNGIRAVRARTPNASKDTSSWWKITSSTATLKSPPKPNTPITMKVSGNIAAWNDPTDVELVYMQNNESAQKRLGSIDEKAQSFTLSTPNRWNPEIFTYDRALSIPFAGKPCYFENALEMLDEPGEWYLERATGILHYWPRPDEDLTKAEVIAPVLQNTMLAVAGTADKPVMNLHFSGLHVEHLDWTMPPWGYMALFCCNVSTDGPKPGHQPIEAAVEFKYAQNCSFSNGGITDAGGMGLCLRNGTSDITIEGNEIGNLGGGGITLGWSNVAAGYLDAAPPPAPGEFTNYRIANNYIHDCGKDYFGAVGILVTGTSHSVISHNLVQDTAYIGIAVAGTQNPKVDFGGDNLIEFNHVHNAMQTTIDGAGIYITFPQKGGGTRLVGNVIHDTFGNPNHEHDGQKWGDHPPSAGIYLDCNCDNTSFEQNLLYRNFAAGPLIFDYPNAREKNKWSNNFFFKDGMPPAEFIEAAERIAGLEPEYAAKLTKTADKTCERTILGDPSPDAAWSAIQFNLPDEGRGVIAVLFRDKYDGSAIQLKPQGLTDIVYQVQGYRSAEAPDKVWGPGEFPQLGKAELVNPGTLGFENFVPGHQLLDTGLTLKPDKGAQAIWLTYHK